jgi:DNA polymerase-3 subunit delta
MPFTLLHGLDEFALTEAVDALRQGWGDPALASLNTNWVEGRTATFPAIRSLCETMPFLAAQRLVIVDGWLTRLLAKGDDDADAEGDGSEKKGASTSKEAQTLLADYAAQVPATTRLVLVENRALPEKNIVLKTAQKLGAAKFFDVPKGEELVKWIMARAKQAGGKFAPDAARALAQVEGDPRALGHEIDKLLTYVAFARAVETEDVELLTPAGGAANIFNLVDALGQRRAAVALRELHSVLEKAEPLYVLGMIARQFRLMLQAKELLEQRHTEAEIARTLSLHPYPTGKICQQSKAFSLTALERIYHRLLDTDIDIKTGQMEPRAALDTLVGALTT